MTNSAPTPAKPVNSLPPLKLPDLIQALNLTEARVRWLEGDGTLPKAERDDEGRLIWDVSAIQSWVKSEAGMKFIAGLKGLA